MSVVRYKGKEFKVKNKLKLRGKGINDIFEIEGLSDLTHLVSLNLGNNNISEIKGLENLTNLKKLLLYNNKIKEIKGLETLTNLTYLHLSKNEITEIKGLDNFTNLQRLNLEKNPFHEIKGLESLINLRAVDLGFRVPLGKTKVRLHDTIMPKEMRKALKIKLPGGRVPDTMPNVNAQKLVEYCQHKKENKQDSPFAAFYDWGITPQISPAKDNLNMQKICPACKKVNKETSKFCVGCGARLGDV